MRICRAEIARCQVVTPRPNFVVLLRDRHGWRPSAWVKDEGRRMKNNRRKRLDVLS